MVGKALASSLDRAQEILRVIDALKPGDRVVVVWHDACRVTNDHDVRPEYYSTPKETQGTVFDCLPDPEYPDVFYLIIWGESTGGRPDYYDAIPVAWIARIQSLTASPVKFSRKIRKILPVGTRTVSRVMRFRKGQLVEDSGGVNKIALRYINERRPLKFIEEISKIIV